MRDKKIKKERKHQQEENFGTVSTKHSKDIQDRSTLQVTEKKDSYIGVL